MYIELGRRRALSGRGEQGDGNKNLVFVRFQFVLRQLPARLAEYSISIVPATINNATRP